MVCTACDAHRHYSSRRWGIKRVPDTSKARYKLYAHPCAEAAASVRRRSTGQTDGRTDGHPTIT